MKKSVYFLISSIFVSFFILVFSLVFAEEESPAPPEKPGYKIGPEIRQIEKKAKERFDNLKQNVRPASQERKEEKKEEVKIRVQETRLKVREEVEAKKAQLKERLQSVRNENKQKTVERVSQQMDELNVRMMNHFSQVLNRLEKVLANIVSRVDKAEANNWDVSAVRAMIKSADQALASAKAAIEVQAAKNYTPQITGEEEKLRVEVGEARKALHRDLAAVKEKVKAAHEFVKAVAKALAQSPRINELERPKANE